MRFTYGATRWVILTSRYAIKVARPRPIQPFIGLFKAIRGKDVKEKLKKHHTNVFLAIPRYLFLGIISNRNEYLVYKNHGNKLLVPTLVTRFYVVNVEKRGNPATKKDLVNSEMALLLAGTEFEEEVMQPCQFCIIDGALLLHDYALDGFDEVMAAYNARAKGTS